MANRKLHSLRDVIELELHNPCTSENVWLVMRLMDESQHKLFLGRAIELVELSPDEDYTVEDENHGISCLINSPELAGLGGEIREVAGTGYDGSYIICDSIHWKQKSYSGFIDHLHCLERTSISLDIEDVMLEQQAVEWLLANFQRYKSEKVTRPLKLNMQEQREEALTAYLIARTFEQPNIELQNRYRQIGEPDKDELWTELQKVVPRLFSAGKDDFFKAPFFTPGLPQFKLELRKKPIGRPPKA